MLGRNPNFTDNQDQIIMFHEKTVNILHVHGLNWQKFAEAIVKVEVFVGLNLYIEYNNTFVLLCHVRNVCHMLLLLLPYDYLFCHITQCMQNKDKVICFNLLVVKKKCWFIPHSDNLMFGLQPTVGEPGLFCLDGITVEVQQPPLRLIFDGFAFVCSLYNCQINPHGFQILLLSIHYM